MPFAIYKMDVGDIVTILGYPPSSDPEKVDARTAAGLAVKEVSIEVSRENAKIDPATKEIISLVTTKGDYYIQEYDTNTGVVGGGCLGTLDHVLAPDTVPGRLVSTKPLGIFPRWILTLDEKGMPTYDVDGKIVASPPEPDLTPNILHLLLSAAVTAGTLDPAQIPQVILDEVNARMATVGAEAILAPAKPASPIV